MRRRRAAAALFVCAATACAHVLGARSLAAARPGETTFHTLRAGGRERSYLLHVPAHDDGARRPLLVVFHGNTGNAATVRLESNLDAAADRLGWVVAYPNGTGALRYADLSWDVLTCCGYAVRHHVDDVAFARALVDTLIAEERVDRSHVYAAGFSSGGTLSLLLACTPHTFVAGVASVAGTMPDTACVAPASVSVMLVRGERDDELARDHAENVAHNAPPYASSFDATQSFWAERVGCTSGTSADTTALAIVIHSVGCPRGREVQQVVVRGQAHAWPGGAKPWFFSPTPSTLDGATLMLEFFARAWR